MRSSRGSWKPLPIIATLGRLDVLQESGQADSLLRRGLDNLQQVELLLQGSRFLLRSEIKGHASQAIRAAEVAMPPALQEIA